MEEGNILLLMQLLNIIQENTVSLEQASQKKDKQAFDFAKNNILDCQKKIEFILK